jgi:hypothetical protein
MVRAGLLLLGCVLWSACHDEVPGIDEPGTESIRMEISLNGDVCGVVSASATVTAADIETIGPVALQVTDTSIVGRISSVPAGSRRTVSVSAFNAAQLEVYAGSAEMETAQ